MNVEYLSDLRDWYRVEGKLFSMENKIATLEYKVSELENRIKCLEYEQNGY